MKKNKRKPAMKNRTVHVYHYTLWDILQASPTEPLPAAHITHQLTRMYEGLRALVTAPQPSIDDWRVCSDAVNLMETLVDMKTVEDASGLLLDAITALAKAGNRYKQGHALRLDAAGINALRSVLEDYDACINALPARTMMQAHRLTEKRIHDILHVRKRPHDVEVMDL